MPNDDGPSRSRSRFSISSLLPARHPPIHDSSSHPLPRMHTHDVPRHHVMMEALSAPSPVHSYRASPGEEYLSPLDRLDLLGPAGPQSAMSSYSTENERIDFSASPPRAKRADRRAADSPPQAEKKRPPPLDLARTRRAYPVPAATNELSAGSPPSGPSPPVRPRRPDDIHQPPVPAKAEPPAVTSIAPAADTKENKKIRRKAVDDDMRDDVAIVDIGHTYSEWQGGKVDIRPGEIIPPGLIRPSQHEHAQSQAPLAPPPSHNPETRRERRQTDRYTKPLQVYDSVLHDVLLEQVYLEPSPGMVLTPSPTAVSFRSGHDRYGNDTQRPNTLLGHAGEALRSAKRIASDSKWVPRGILKREDSDAEMAIRRIREREAAEMGRYRNAIRGIPTQRLPDHDDDDDDDETPHRSWGRQRDIEVKTYGDLPNSHSHGRKAHGRLERGLESLGQAAWRSVSGAREKQTEAWRTTRAKEEKAARRQKIWKCGIMIFIILLVAMTIGLCATLLTRSGSSSSTSQSSDPASTQSNGGTSTVSVPPAPNFTSATLHSCLSRYSDTANAYPCSDCVPLLASTTNDFLQPLVNGNATNVGAALQYCAMMDLFREMNTTGVTGWGQDRSVCGWTGVQCDPRGRVGNLRMVYPNVPRQLPPSLGNLVGLGALHITGNSTVPTGSFPHSIFGPNLGQIDLQYTALTGPIATANWSAVPSLTSLYLANNKNLGTSLPNLSGNSKLVTLAATGQGISSINSDTLPSSLTYIDLSYNALTGQIPSFSQITYLKTLYLQNNNLTQSPASLPANLEVLSFTANPDLSGPMPAALCASSTLTSCDLRSTKLGGPNITTIAVSFSGTTTSTPSSAPASTTSSRSCGSCRYN